MRGDHDDLAPGLETAADVSAPAAEIDGRAVERDAGPAPGRRNELTLKSAAAGEVDPDPLTGKKAGLLNDGLQVERGKIEARVNW